MAHMFALTIDINSSIILAFNLCINTHNTGFFYINQSVLAVTNTAPAKEMYTINIFRFRGLFIFGYGFD